MGINLPLLFKMTIVRKCIFFYEIVDGIFGIQSFGIVLILYVIDINCTQIHTCISNYKTASTTINKCV